MALSLAASQVNELKLADNLCFRVFDVLLSHCESQNAMRSTACVVYVMRRHDFVFQTLPKVLEPIAYILAVELKTVFNNCFPRYCIEFQI